GDRRRRVPPARRPGPLTGAALAAATAHRRPTGGHTGGLRASDRRGERISSPAVNLATIIDPHPGEATALISRGRETDYDTLRTQVAALRGALVEMGLEPGERLAIIAGNNWYFVVSYLAALGAGLVAVPLNPTNPAVS